MINYHARKKYSRWLIKAGLRQKCGYHILAETYPPFGKGGQGGFVIKARGYLFSLKSPPNPSLLKRGEKLLYP